MISDYFYSLLAEAFPHEFTPGQQRAAMALASFVTTPRDHAAFILRGYAGTGKTSLVGALVQTMRRLERDVVLMAPTGRAAKVFSAHADGGALTIHKTIYRQQTFQGEGTRFSLGFNKLRNALFIVDEASMVAFGSGDSVFGTGMLLDDLISYVYEGTGCRLLLVGDTAQLPPVGEDESPALQPETLAAYGLLVGKVDLTEVVRQSATSSVLAGATHLRQLLTSGFTGLPRVAGSPDGEVRFLPGDELIEALVTAYADCGQQGTIVVTRSNKRANVYNNGIRSRIFDREGILTRGDVVMAVKNNYFWVAQKAAAEATTPVAGAATMSSINATTSSINTSASSINTSPSAGQTNSVSAPALTFIANGDTAEVIRLHNVHEMHGFTFADATLRFTDYDDTEVDCRVLLDTLSSESPALTREEQRRLYESVLADYADIPAKRERMKAVREDPYYNALQIKYAYAVTCHKAQGGQWGRVFVDQGYLAPEMIDASYLRWLYTAFTRTTDRLYLVNWPESQRAVAEERSENTEEKSANAEEL